MYVCHCVRRRHRDEPELPEPSVGRATSQRVVVRVRERLQAYAAPFENDRRWCDHAPGYGPRGLNARASSGIFSKSTYDRAVRREPRVADAAAVDRFISSGAAAILERSLSPR